MAPKSSHCRNGTFVPRTFIRETGARHLFLSSIMGKRGEVTERGQRTVHTNFAVNVHFFKGFSPPVPKHSRNTPETSNEEDTL